MASGWGARAHSVELFRNTDSSGVMHFPGFGKDQLIFYLPSVTSVELELIR